MCDQQVMHTRITCDECGVVPIAGTRYKAKRIFDYDLCEACLGANHRSDHLDFVPFQEPVMESEAVKVCEVQDDRLMVNGSVSLAADKIQRNQDKTVAFLNFAWDFHASGNLGNALKQNVNLQVVHIHLGCARMRVRPEEATQAAIEIAKGIEANTSIKRLFWHIGKCTRENKDVADAMNSMLSNNKTLEACYISRPCGRNTQYPSVSVRSNYFAAQLFRGLALNPAITSFRLRSFNVLSEDVKVQLLSSVKANRRLERVDGDFDQADHRLDLLMTCRRNDWINRLGDTDASDKKRFEVLIEALTEMPMAPVATSYHLLRSCPDIIQRWLVS